MRIHSSKLHVGRLVRRHQSNKMNVSREITCHDSNRTTILHSQYISGVIQSCTYLVSELTTSWEMHTAYLAQHEANWPTNVFQAAASSRLNPWNPTHQPVHHFAQIRPPRLLRLYETSLTNLRQPMLYSPKSQIFRRACKYPPQPRDGLATGSPETGTNVYPYSLRTSSPNVSRSC
jgi:hypothetical protein